MAAVAASGLSAVPKWSPCLDSVSAGGHSAEVPVAAGVEPCTSLQLPEALFYDPLQPG